MPVSVAPLAAPSASVAAPDPRSPRAGDPVCVAFTQAAGPFRHAGTRILDLDLAPLLAAAAAAAGGTAAAAAGDATAGPGAGAAAADRIDLGARAA